MARTARKVSSMNIYHVMVRGADRQRIFEETKDYLKYLEILEFYKEECEFQIYAFALMSNHIHLLIYTPKTPLHSIFVRVNTKYAVWFNMKYDRTGFLQQGRYYSEPVETLSYLLTVIRYIHLNPMKAGYEELPGKKYEWNSIHEYNKGVEKLVNTKYIVDLFGGMEGFSSFHRAKIEDKCLDIDNVRKRIPDDVAKDIMEKISGCQNVTSFQKLGEIDQKHYIKLMKKEGLSIRQLNRITGISKGIIERYLEQKKAN